MDWKNVSTAVQGGANASNVNFNALVESGLVRLRNAYPHHRLVSVIGAPREWGSTSADDFFYGLTIAAYDPDRDINLLLNVDDDFPTVWQPIRKSSCSRTSVSGTGASVNSICGQP